MITATFKRSFVAALAMAAVIGFGPRADATPVAVELALGVDVSGSVDATEYTLQMTGYANAFNNAGVRNAIINSQNGIAAMLYQWSSSNQQQVAGDGWYHLTDNDSIDTFVAMLTNLANAANRAFSGLTGIGAAIDFARNAIETNGFDGIRKVIDISADGTNNSGVAPATARDLAADAGISINGIWIQSPSLEAYFQNNVITGPNSFVLGATSFEDFGTAVTRKIRAEITGEDPNTPSYIPLPAAGWLLLTALGGLGVFGRRRRQAA